MYFIFFIVLVLSNVILDLASYFFSIENLCNTALGIQHLQANKMANEMFFIYLTNDLYQVFR